MTDDLYLPMRSAWMHQSIFRGIPSEPKTGDRGPVWDAIGEIADAAGGLEYSRAQLGRAIVIAQEEFNGALKGRPDLWGVQSWGGVNTPAVYYEFCSVVAWTRAVRSRYEDRLLPAIEHDGPLRQRLRPIRQRASREFEDARLLAQVGLHKYTPPYPAAGAKVTVEGILVYPVPRITDPDDFRENLRTLSDDRHVASIAAGFWSAATRFVDDLLDVLYP
jgi:hypothetical protein